MKTLTLLTSVFLVLLISCQKENEEPEQEPQQTSNNSYSVVVHRFEINKKAQFDDFCGSAGELNCDVIFGIDVDNVTNSNYGLDFAQFTDSLRNANSPNENLEQTYTYSSIQFGNFLNRVKLRDVSNNHDYSYFTSSSDKKVFDYVITDTYYVPIFEYKYYPDGTVNCPETKGSITYGAIDIDNVGTQGDDTDYFISNDTLYVVTAYDI